MRPRAPRAPGCREGYIFVSSSSECSEDHFKAKLKLPSGRGRRREFAKVRITDGKRRACRAGQEEGRRVSQVESFRPELNVESLTNSEVAEDREVQIIGPRPPTGAPRERPEIDQLHAFRIR